MNLIEASTGEIMGEVGREIILANGKARLTADGLFIESELTMDEWEGLGLSLAELFHGIHWAIGDWLNYGEAKWGEACYQFISELFTPQTLANDKWVASRVPASLRKEELSYTHHALVAPLEPEQQAVLLDRAVKEDMTTRDLHREVRRVRAEVNNGTRRVEIVISGVFLMREDALDEFRRTARAWGGEMAAREGVACIEFSVERS